MSNITMKRIKHTAKLEKLIKEEAPYEMVLKQSRILDRYIYLEFKRMNRLV